LTEASYDLVIIGGGIHGVGAAQAGAAAGYSVLVLEQNSLAAGTSSRSSKLIHGGLRYLESAQLGLVRECLHERALLLKLAPSLIKLQPFYLPIYKHTRRHPWQIRAGLSLYATLGGLNKAATFKEIPRCKWGELDGLATHDLQKVYRYFDGQTDDAALTRAVMHSAQSLGAKLELPAKVVSIEIDGDDCSIRYQADTQERHCRAKVIINAAGPWANQVLNRVSPKASQLPIDLVQGTHIIVDGQLTQGVYYVEAPQDQRAVFAIPWKGQTMVGTTETIYSGDPANVAPLPQEESYLCDVLGSYFPRYRGITREQIQSSFAGLRVLPKAPGNAFSRPRETLLHLDNQERPRIATIYGGKLTAYRLTSEKLIQQLTPHLPERPQRGDTRQLRLLPV